MPVATSVPPEYWSLSAEELVRALGTSPQGLSAGEAATRLVRYGSNSLEHTHRATALSSLLRQFTSPLVLILLFATLVSLVVGEWVDAGIILAIVLGSGLLSFYQEYNAESAAEALRARVTARAQVLRDGTPSAIPIAQVVPGDVVKLTAGSLVPGDGVALEQRDVLVNQAVLTGESYPAEKRVGVSPADAAIAERANCLFMGTSVRSGSATLLVVRTGKATEFGHIAGRLELRPPETEFETGIRHFGGLLTQVTLVLLVLVFAANVFFQKPVLDSFLFALALAVGIAPELLPAIITINLSRGSQQMAKGGVIVRRLASIENFGSMDVLCTDKTGTLTSGTLGLEAALDARGQSSQDVLLYAQVNAHLQAGLANPLDEALTRQAQPGLGRFSKLDEFPYDFTRKRLSVVVQEGDKRLLITKGALEKVTEVCDRVQLPEGERPLDSSLRADLDARYREYSDKGVRVLGVALKEVSARDDYDVSEEKALVFIGFLLFADPPKPGILETVRDLQGLGVQLKVVTGDNQFVARHVAAQIGLRAGDILTGPKLAHMPEDALLQLAERTDVFAEVDPSQKERIILALKKMGHVVGYMGDGINDAPPLHAADVGISVDTAVDVAKEAADLVLLEKDLAVLHQGVVQGRITFANSLKYVFITTSANFGNMLSMAGASLFLPFLPMLPKQILLTNFLSDIPAMTIAGDAVDAESTRVPRRWNVRFIRDFMLLFGAISSVFDYLTFGLLLVFSVGEGRFQSGWFVESMLTELMILLVMRTRRPLWRSRPSRLLLFATVAAAVATVALPYLPFAAVLGFVPLPPALLAALVAITALYSLASEWAKHRFFPRETG
ncbi:MAG: magnesium-translocating P-type ATPase [Anaerolineae bacterium]